MMVELPGLMPVRIAVVCRNMTLPCPNSHSGEPAHTHISCRSTAMVYLPVGGEMSGLPKQLNRGVFDPPFEVAGISIQTEQALRFLAILHHN